MCACFLLAVSITAAQSGHRSRGHVFLQGSKESLPSVAVWRHLQPHHHIPVKTLVQTSAMFSSAQTVDLQHAGERASSAVETSATETSQTERCASLPLSYNKGTFVADACKPVLHLHINDADSIDPNLRRCLPPCRASSSAIQPAASAPTRDVSVNDSALEETGMTTCRQACIHA